MIRSNCLNRSPGGKIEAAIECRTSLIASVIALKRSQEALPQVDIPHITQRQIVAVSHANEYMLTDIANIDRYRHSQRVFDVYQRSLGDSTKWIGDKFRETLKKDFDDSGDTMQAIAKQLRQIRLSDLHSKIGNRLFVVQQ